MSTPVTNNTMGAARTAGAKSPTAEQEEEFAKLVNEHIFESSKLLVQIGQDGLMQSLSQLYSSSMKRYD